MLSGAKHPRNADRSRMLKGFLSRMHDACVMKHEAYWVYIISSRSGTLYIGSTNDLMRRIWEHKNGILDGFTQKVWLHAARVLRKVR